MNLAFLKHELAAFFVIKPMVFVVFRSDHMYINILGVAKDVSYAFRGVESLEDAWRQS